MSFLKEKQKTIWLEWLPIFITFVCIFVCTIVLKQQFIKVLPLFISLFVMLLNSHANRLGFLLGGTNCFIYAIGYTMEGLYGTVIATIFGGIVQYVSFFMWKKRAYGSSTVFRRMKNSWRILFSVGILTAWAISSFVLWKVGGNEFVLDGLSMVLAYAAYVLTMFAFIENVPIALTSLVIGNTLWIRIILSGNIANVTYLIYNIYASYMSIRAQIRWIKLYKEQRAKKVETI